MLKRIGHLSHSGCSLLREARGKPKRSGVVKGTSMNSLLEYILVGIVTLGVLIYLVVALLAPEKF
jgi:K+-transporting ATPase KdpF subunit